MRGSVTPSVVERVNEVCFGISALFPCSAGAALVAQMVERKTLNLVVVGSSPTEGALFF